MWNMWRKLLLYKDKQISHVTSIDINTGAFGGAQGGGSGGAEGKVRVSCKEELWL